MREEATADGLPRLHPAQLGGPGVSLPPPLSLCVYVCVCFFSEVPSTVSQVENVSNVWRAKHKTITFLYVETPRRGSLSKKRLDWRAEMQGYGTRMQQTVKCAYRTNFQ